MNAFHALWLLLAGTRDKKRLVQYKLAEVVANVICDCWFPEDRKLWLQDERFLRAYRKFDPKNRRSAERKFAVRSLVYSLEDFPGDTAECGVFRGATSYFICEARGRKGTHHLFDSFAGLSAPVAADKPSDEEARPWSVGALCATEEEVKRNLAEFPFVEYHPGWIPDRFENVVDREFCFVHIDVDLYQPTLDSLSFFYPNLVSGGMIVCDDYGYSTCPGAKKACDEFIAEKPERLIHLPTGQGLIIKQ